MLGMHSLQAQVSSHNPRRKLQIAADRRQVLPGPTLSISDLELNLIGKGPTANATVKIPDELGDGYFATLEVFHNLHCLVGAS